MATFSPLCTPATGSKVYTTKDGHVTNEAAQAFVDEIAGQLDAGYGFVPFIGAGVSAPSGAPLVRELETYLHRCIGLALGVDERTRRPWIPRTDQWPPFTDKAATHSEDWWLKVRNTFEQLQKADWTPDVQVFQEALGAMAEWRTSLTFLSRLTREHQREEPASLSLDAPVNEVLDTCLREVMKGKHPTLGHRMLSLLAGILRLDVLISTNFDDLLERAFERSRNPLTVFEVHLNSPLPPWSAINGQRSLIKLHGSRHSLRADYSLDALPAEADRNRMLEYLVSANGRSALYDNLHKMALPRSLDVSNYLIVMGSSATERRTRAFVEHAWRCLSEEFKVFWICHSGRSVRAAVNLTQNFVQRENKPSTWTGSHIIPFPDAGLLLLQLFQTIRRGVPTTGISFPSVSRLALPPMRTDRVLTEPGAAILRKQIKGRLESFQGVFGRTKLIVITSLPGIHGVTTLGAEVFEELHSSSACIWLDMNDITSTSDLFEVLLDAAYYRLGLEHWMPVYIAKDPRPRAEEIRRVTKALNRRWVLFINARETPGANVETTSSPGHGLPNGWLDFIPGTQNIPEDEDASQSSFLRLLTELCGQDSPLLSVVLLCRSGGTSSLVDNILSNNLVKHAEVVTVPSLLPAYSHDSAVVRALEWTASDPLRRHFLHSLVILQRTRFLAVIWSDGTTDFNTAMNWLTELESVGLLRRKAGGFIWLHSRARNQLREALFDLNTRHDLISRHSQLSTVFANWNPAQDDADIHWRHAQWYERLLSASDMPAAVFEAMYHACRSSSSALSDAKQRNSDLPLQGIEWAAALLSRHGFLTQTQGYSRGSCRRLTFIRDTLCADIDSKSAGLSQQAEIARATARLRLKCTEAMRAIAREVGEDLTAYRRHRQIKQLLCNRSVDERLAQSGPAANKADLYDSLKKGPTPIVRDSAAEWVRYWRWLAMLGIESRSYGAARECLTRCLSNVVPTAATQAVLPATCPEVLDLLRTHMSSHYLSASSYAGIPSIDSKSLNVEVLRAIEQFVALLLQQSSLKREGIVSPWDKDFTSIRDVTSLAQQLANRLIAHDVSPDNHLSQQVIWCKSRLHMHESICAAQAAEWENALKNLADAESLLNTIDGGRRDTDRAIVELHRAEVCLLRAEHVSITLSPNTGHTVNFRQFCAELPSSANKSTLWRPFAAHARAQWLGLPAAEIGLRRAKALAEDAIGFLNRAERILVSRRRNVWWTTWFFRRKLLAIAMLNWASINEVGTPIPYLGLEAAARGVPTVADTLLDDTLRMIRVDSYRLATVISGYLSCACALHMRLMFDKSAVLLPERQKNMWSSIEVAMARLGHVCVERQRNLGASSTMGTASKAGNPKWDVDKAVGEYVTERLPDLVEAARPYLSISLR